MKSFLFFFLALFATSTAMAADNSDKSRMYYFYTVGNQIALSDFNLGSQETIKDRDGNGLGYNFVLRKGKRINLAIDYGYSRTQYTGTVEDAVVVTFVPQAGTDYEALSSSTNVSYVFDTVFSNPYLGINLSINQFRIGGGRIFQSVKGGVTLESQNVELVKAHYVGAGHLYGMAGFDFDIDEFYLGLYGRMFEAPELVMDSCNSAAVGSTVCDRIEAAINNRNNQSRVFTEGLITLGLLF